MQKPLSNPQTRIYTFIEKYSREFGRPPTNREIGKAVDIHSTGHVDYHLTMLEKKGYIERERKTSRGIRVVREAPTGLRVHGLIAAGAPLDIFADDQQEMLDLTQHARRDTSEYVLQVRGSSMIEDHIADGDYVLVDPEAHVGDGDIIVATRKTATGEHGAATLKRIFKERDRIRLQPANQEMDPIYVGAAEWDREWTVQGKVTAVYRRC
jgi:repressor LexA